MASSAREVDTQLIVSIFLLIVIGLTLLIELKISLWLILYHTSPDPIEIGGGLYGSQTILPMRISVSDEDFSINY